MRRRLGLGVYIRLGLPIAIRCPQVPTFLCLAGFEFDIRYVCCICMQSYNDRDQRVYLIARHFCTTTCRCIAVAATDLLHLRNLGSAATPGKKKKKKKLNASVTLKFVRGMSLRSTNSQNAFLSLLSLFLVYRQVHIALLAVFCLRGMPTWQSFLHLTPQIHFASPFFFVHTNAHKARQPLTYPRRGGVARPYPRWLCRRQSSHAMRGWWPRSRPCGTGNRHGPASYRLLHCSAIDLSDVVGVRSTDERRLPALHHGKLVLLLLI